jgi:DNA-binding transcriptional LysR family regulator
MAFNLRLIRTFLAIARRQNITQAAVDLGVSQPAVSRSVRELERQTRAVLLERTPSGVRLTEAGQALLVHARNIFAEARAAEEDLEALADLTQGTLRVGGSPTIATYLLPPLLHTFHSRYPGVELRLTSAPSRAIARLLAEREIDVALIETPVEEPRLQSVVWAEDHLIVVAAPSHGFPDRSPVAPAALAHELLVTREPGSGTYDTVMRALREVGVSPKRRLEVDTAEAIIQLVASGLGFAVVSRHAAADTLALGRLRVVDVTGLRIRRPLMRLSLLAAGESAATRAFGTVLDALGTPDPATPTVPASGARAKTSPATRHPRRPAHRTGSRQVP